MPGLPQWITWLGKWKSLHTGCDLIGQASHYGLPLMCAVAQERIPFLLPLPKCHPSMHYMPLQLCSTESKSIDSTVESDMWQLE